MCWNCLLQYSWFVYTRRDEQLCTGPVIMATLMQLNYCWILLLFLIRWRTMKRGKVLIEKGSIVLFISHPSFQMKKKISSWDIGSEIVSILIRKHCTKQSWARGKITFPCSVHLEPWQFCTCPKLWVLLMTDSHLQIGKRTFFKLVPNIWPMKSWMTRPRNSSRRAEWVTYLNCFY